MQWQDKALILSLRKTGESSVVITVFTENNGTARGMLRGAMSKKDKGSFQPGNIVNIKWQARLAEQLGTITINDTLRPFSALLMNDALKLQALNSLLVFIKDNIPEHDPHSILFSYADSLLDFMVAQKIWLHKYILFELFLLQELGFGLELDKCAASGVTEDLIYASPKSGRAVCKEAGKPYKDKLLPLPVFLIKSEENTGNYIDNIHNTDMVDGLRLTGFFIEKYIYRSRNKELPLARRHLFSSFVNLTKKQLA